MITGAVSETAAIIIIIIIIIIIVCTHLHYSICKALGIETTDKW